MAQVAQLRTDAQAQKPISFIPENQQKEIIQPFGGFLWDDGLHDILEKINKLQGVETVKDNAGGDLKQVRTEGDMYAWLNGNNFTDFTTPVSPDLAKVPFELARLSHEDKSVKTSLTASPLNVSGIPFELSILFSFEHGFWFANPAKVPIFLSPVTNRTNLLGGVSRDHLLQMIAVLKHQKQRMGNWASENKGMLLEEAEQRINNTYFNKDIRLLRLFPWAIKHVALTSTSPIIPGKLDELIAAIKQKYPNGEMIEPKNTPPNREGLFREEDKHGFKFVMKWTTSPEKSTVSLVYTRPDALWDDIYKKHIEPLKEAERLREIEKENSCKAADMKSAL